jgi:hypothetical protein
MRGMRLCITASVYSYALQEQKYHTNVNEAQNLYVVSRLKFYVLEWCYCFCCKSNIMYRKIDKTIYGNCLHSTCVFNIYDSTDKENPVHHSKEP